MSNLHRSLANAQLCPRVLLSVLYLKNMPLSKPSIPCVILKTLLEDGQSYDFRKSAYDRSSEH